MSGNEAKPYSKAQQLARGAKRYRRKVASAKQWQAICAAKGGPCRVCGTATTYLQAWGASSITFHHVIPRDLGGDDVKDNIVPLCFACHERVTARKPGSCLNLCASLTDAEYAYAVDKLGEGVFERVYGVTYGR
jgi:5-methylcytosine-specific restriction endonuclease McrA